MAEQVRFLVKWALTGAGLAVPIYIAGFEHTGRLVFAVAMFAMADAVAFHQHGRVWFFGRTLRQPAHPTAREGE